MTDPIACIDIGSTFTKGALVDPTTGTVTAQAQTPTTVLTDVMTGVDAVLADLGAGATTSVLACSSAGGGLRLAVVGYERSVTAEAGHRVGLSAGARIVHVAAGPLDPAGVTALHAGRPDIVLLVGGTDGGNAEVLLHNAHRLASSHLTLTAPVVVAGNTTARDDVADILRSRGRPYSSPTTSFPRSARSPRVVLGPRSGRRSCVTSSAAPGCHATHGSPAWYERRLPTPSCAGSRSLPTLPARTCSSSISAVRRRTSTRA